MTNIEIAVVVASAAFGLAVNYLIVRDFKKHVSDQTALIGVVVKNRLTEAEQGILERVRKADQGLGDYIRKVTDEVKDHVWSSSVGAKNSIVNHLTEHADDIKTAVVGHAAAAVHSALSDVKKAQYMTCATCNKLSADWKFVGGKIECADCSIRKAL